jgi:hypothetical protein
MVKQEIQRYYSSWAHFEKYCERKAKDRCTLNNNSWRKLRDYHFERYLTEVSNPYKFLFMIKTFHFELYRAVPGMRKFYHKHSKKRRQEITESFSQRYMRVLKKNMV